MNTSLVSCEVNQGLLWPWWFGGDLFLLSMMMMVCGHLYIFRLCPDALFGSTVNRWTCGLGWHQTTPLWFQASSVRCEVRTTQISTHKKLKRKKTRKMNKRCFRYSLFSSSDNILHIITVCNFLLDKQTCCFWELCWSKQTTLSPTLSCVWLHTWPQRATCPVYLFIPISLSLFWRSFRWGCLGALVCICICV